MVGRRVSRVSASFEAAAGRRRAHTGSGGLRKVRWQVAGRGKRGGARVICYWQAAAQRVYLLFLYPTNVRSTLSSVELRTLRKLVTGDSRRGNDA